MAPSCLQDAISKVIGEVDDLDFSRYGDTLFEVIFTGHALQPGSVVPLEDASDQPWNVLACGEPSIYFCPQGCSGHLPVCLPLPEIWCPTLPALFRLCVPEILSCNLLAYLHV